MARWFRVYDGLVDDPKAQRLSAENFRALINLWCLASIGDGVLPPLADIAFKLRMSEDKASKIVVDLQKAGLFTQDETGLRPHNWSARQFKSDVSNERVKRHRERQRNVTPAVTETSPDTETDTEAERDMKNISLEAEREFEIWYAAYPRHVGKGQARRAYRSARQKADAAILLDGAAKASVEFAGRQPNFIPHPATWLNGERWADADQSVPAANDIHLDKNGNAPGDPYYGADY